MLFLPTSIVSLALLLITPTLAAPSRPRSPRSPPTSQELFVAPGTVLPSAAVETPRAAVAAPIFVPSLPLFVAPPQSRGGWWAAAGDSTATMDWFGSVQPSHTIAAVAAPARANANSGEERMRRKVELAARGSVGRKSNTRSPSKADRKRIELLAARKQAARREFIGL
ncbi:hypothetical protein RQP46_010558 [Phenoliferia psychrophenolica]